MIRRQEVILEVVYDDGKVIAPANWDWALALHVLFKDKDVYSVQVTGASSTTAVQPGEEIATRFEEDGL